MRRSFPHWLICAACRAQAYVILAWGHLSAQGAEGIETVADVAQSAARRLVECYHRSMRPGWPWFESRMTYANAVLPHALFVAARHWPEEGFLDVATTSFAFLDHETTTENVFWPVGNSDWYPHGEEKALYDQQPVEATTMAEAALAAFDLLGDESYLANFSAGTPLVPWREQLETTACRRDVRRLL